MAPSSQTCSGEVLKEKMAFYVFKFLQNPLVQNPYDYNGADFCKGCRQKSVIFSEMHFMVDFSRKSSEGRDRFFICLVSKLLENSLEMTTVEFFLQKVGAITQ